MILRNKINLSYFTCKLNIFSLSIYSKIFIYKTRRECHSISYISHLKLDQSPIGKIGKSINYVYTEVLSRCKTGSRCLVPTAALGLVPTEASGRLFC